MDRKNTKERTLVLCVQVSLIGGNRLCQTSYLTCNPYCKVWVGPKGLIEPPFKGFYYSTVCHTTNPSWGRNHTGMTKALYDTVGNEYMIPPTDPKQDCWTFLWHEGEVIHIQIWDRSLFYSIEHDGYMGNVSFPLHINKAGPQKVEGVVHSGPTGHLRSKAKVSGSIEIEWVWKSRTDVLHIDQWIPLLQELTHGDDRVLSFLRQEDLLPHVSLPVAQFILGQIAKGYVILPHQNTTWVSSTSIAKKKIKLSSDRDWANEFADEDQEGTESDTREPDGLVFIACGPKVFSVDFWDNDTILDLKKRIISLLEGVSASDLSFTCHNQQSVSDDVLVSQFASMTLRVCGPSVDSLLKTLSNPTHSDQGWRASFHEEYSHLGEIPICSKEEEKQEESPQHFADYTFDETPPHSPETPTPTSLATTSSAPSSANSYKKKKKKKRKSRLSACFGSFCLPTSIEKIEYEEAPSSATEGLNLSGDFLEFKGRASSFSRGGKSRRGSACYASDVQPQFGYTPLESQTPQVQRGPRTATFSVNQPPKLAVGAPPKPARMKGGNIISSLASLMLKEDAVSFEKYLKSLSLEQLTNVIPILVAFEDDELVMQLLEKNCKRSKIFLNRVRMIHNHRSQFDHLTEIVGDLPLSSFLETFLDPDLSFSQGQVFKIDSFHPLTNNPIDEVKVVKIFSSLARPSILSLSHLGEVSEPQILFKRGEDLYSETCLQILFQYMNELWESTLPKDLRPHIFGLREIPGSTERGFLEIVPGVRDLEIVERGNMELITPENDDNFIRTSCGWILASYFLGLSDRHRENTLVRISDGSAIPIDFGFILGNEPPSYNTFCITVSSEMYKYLLRKERWVDFCILLLAGFWAVRSVAQEFIRLAVHLFKGTDRDLEVSGRFISHRMMIGRDKLKAFRQMYCNLRHAPICFFTKKKIDTHAKSKKIPARDDFIGSLARKIGANAARPEKATAKTGGEAGDSLHPGQVSLPLPTSYPEHYPGELVACLLSLQKKS